MSVLSLRLLVQSLQERLRLGLAELLVDVLRLLVVLLLRMLRVLMAPRRRARLWVNGWLLTEGSSRGVVCVVGHLYPRTTSSIDRNCDRLPGGLEM